MSTEIIGAIGQRVMVKCGYAHKEAGLRSALKYLTTGRSTAHHGTSAQLAKKIRQTGLIPKKSRGISDILVEQGRADPRGKNPLAFLTRRKGEGRRYAQQQGFIERAGDSPTNVMQEVITDIAEGKGLKGALSKGWEGWKGMREAGRKGVVGMSYPARKFSPVKNPEPGILMDAAREGLETMGVTGLPAKAILAGNQAQVAPLFMRTFGLPPGKGGVAMPTRYIKGSPDYQRVSLDEIKDHLRHALQHPGGTAAETLRNLFEFQGL